MFEKINILRCVFVELYFKESYLMKNVSFILSIMLFCLAVVTMRKIKKDIFSVTDTTKSVESNYNG